MYTRLARLLCVNKLANQVTRAASMAGANAVQLDVVVFVNSAAATLTLDIQGSNELQNWVSLGTFATTTVGYVSAAKVTNIQWQYVRVRISIATGTAILSIGLNTARLGSALMGTALELKRTYTRVATRLCVTSPAQQVSRAIPMEGANSVQVDFVVFAGPGVGFKVSVLLQGSNDLQNWSQIGGGATVVAVGFNGSLKQSDIAFQFVRLRFVSSGGGPYILAAGLNAVAA